MPLVPNRVGKDIENQDKTIDGHIRIETYKLLGTRIYVDLFDSSTAEAHQAYLISEMFPYTSDGARKSTEFLQGFGFQLEVALR